MPTLTTRVSFPLVSSSKYEVKETVKGALTTRLVHSFNARSWTVNINNATKEEKNVITALYASTAGAGLTFEWTPPGGTLTEVRFVNDTLTYTHVSYNQYNISFVIEEVR